MIVVKVGGSKGINLEAVTSDLAELHQAGQQIILVHGGSHETNEISTQLGHPPRFVTSVSGYESRYTDRATLEIFEMVYCGKINKAIVEMLQQKGVNAIGLSGIDGRLLEGTRKDAIKIVEPDGKRKVLRDDFTGKVEKVNLELINLLTGAGYLAGNYSARYQLCRRGDQRRWRPGRRHDRRRSQSRPTDYAQ